MTINEIIAKVDAIEPNQYDFDTKMGWLSTLDGQLYEEIIKTHVTGDPAEEEIHWKGNPLDQDIYSTEEEETEDEFEPYTDGNQVLLAGVPYGEGMYVSYVQAQIAAANKEISKYNLEITRYNSAYLNFANWYNRKHMPKEPRGGNRFHF